MRTKYNCFECDGKDTKKSCYYIADATKIRCMWRDVADRDIIRLQTHETLTLTDMFKEWMEDKHK